MALSCSSREVLAIITLHQEAKAGKNTSAR